MPDLRLQSAVDPDLSDNPAFADLRRYWESKRRNGAVPLRVDIDPLEMKAHLGSLFIAEALPDGADFRYRLIGTNLTEMHGRDFTGRTVTEVFDGVAPGMAQSVIAGYRKILRERVVLRVGGRLLWAGKEHVQFDSLHLPLSRDGRAADLILGKLAFIATPRGA